MTRGAALKQYRRTKHVSQAALASELGFATAAAIHRRERGEVLMSQVDIAEAMAGIERIVERRANAISPVEAIGGV